MKTAEEVLDWIDQEITEMAQEASEPCISALVEPVDRETYRDALHRASALQALRHLRSKLAPQVESPEKTSNGGRRSRKRRTKS